MNPSHQPTAGMLPPMARRMLAEAASTENTPNDPLARQRAIEHATEQVKQLFPRYFKD
jgi:hypothetical protein